jgi:hypothetical protein
MFHVEFYYLHFHQPRSHYRRSSSSDSSRRVFEPYRTFCAMTNWLALVLSLRQISQRCIQSILWSLWESTAEYIKEFMFERKKRHLMVQWHLLYVRPWIFMARICVTHSDDVWGHDWWWWCGVDRGFRFKGMWSVIKIHFIGLLRFLPRDGHKILF